MAEAITGHKMEQDSLGLELQARTMAQRDKSIQKAAVLTNYL